MADTKYRRHKEKLLRQFDLYSRDVEEFLQRRYQDGTNQDDVLQSNVV